jgi:hypothetical protein
MGAGVVRERLRPQLISGRDYRKTTVKGEDKVTKLAIQIEHRNLPKTKGNIFDAQMSAEEIEDAVGRFGHELSVVAGDSTLKVAKMKFVKGKETVYVITSSLERDALVRAVERTLSGLKLGGTLLLDLPEIRS